MAKYLSVLVACEFSGRVRQAFRDRGHAAWSCDLLPAEDGSIFHLQMDALKAIELINWDIMIAHPPCTHLAISGARHFAEKRADGRQQAALEFVQQLLDAPIPKIALENPVSIISSHIRKPTQYVEPWWFGHEETKRTGLWLKNLPPLVRTNPVIGLRSNIHWMAPGPDRWKNRSRTYTGMAKAMAEQWG